MDSLICGRDTYSSLLSLNLGQRGAGVCQRQAFTAEVLMVQFFRQFLFTVVGVLD
jgi:hypothetical protein